MRTSNPVLTRQFANPYQGQHRGAHRGPSNPWGGGAGRGMRNTAMRNLESTGRTMTVGDVAAKSLVGMVLVAASATLTWIYLPEAASAYLLAWALSGIVSFALVLVAMFRHSVPAPLVMLFAMSQGVFVGLLSEHFERVYPGIVFQAVVGTFAAGLLTLFVYTFFDIRVTSRFRQVVVMATGAFALLMLVNFVVGIFVDGGLGLRSAGPIGLLFAAIGVVLGVLNLVMDFDIIERGVRSGADRSESWRAALGVTLTVVWLYLEILRLLAAIRR